MNPIKFIKGKDLLWLWILPIMLSWLFISAFRPAGRAHFAAEVSVISACSFVCGFGLALRSFKTSRQRFWGGLFFSGCSLWLISSVAFLGCLSPSKQLSPAQIQKNRQQQEIRNKAWVAKQILPRDAGADSSTLDLSPFYNGILPGTTPDNNPFLRFQKPGVHVWDGIKFDVRGIVAGWQIETDSIPVGRKCSEVDFLHGAYGGTPSGLVSQFVIRFANGRSEIIPIIFGEDVSGSHFGNNFVPTNAVVWGERISTNAPSRPTFGFFIKKWNNPFPDETIATIDFVPKRMAFLVAITIQERAEGNK